MTITRIGDKVFKKRIIGLKITDPSQIILNTDYSPFNTFHLPPNKKKILNRK